MCNQIVRLVSQQQPSCKGLGLRIDWRVLVNLLGRLVSESRLLQPMHWAIGAVQNECLAGSILVTLSVARGADPRCFSFSMLDARLLLLIRTLE